MITGGQMSGEDLLFMDGQMSGEDLLFKDASEWGNLNGAGEWEKGAGKLRGEAKQAERGGQAERGEIVKF